MGEPYIGEIRIFAGNFAPNGWMFCEGQLLPISENDALFTLIGTAFGGDGEETFGLPDLRGRLPLHPGNGFSYAENGGTEEVTLTVQQIPIHNHPVLCTESAGTQDLPTNNIFAQSTDQLYFTPTVGLPANTTLHAQSVTPTGGNQPHTNFAPYLCVNFIISLFGVFPTQT
jgi:microcystin-dependent protein